MRRLFELTESCHVHVLPRAWGELPRPRSMELQTCQWLVEYGAWSFLVHAIVLVVVYGAIHGIVYVHWKDFCLNFKYNPKYPPHALLLKEIRRCFVSIAVASFYDVAIYAAARKGQLELLDSSTFLMDMMRLVLLVFWVNLMCFCDVDLT